MSYIKSICVAGKTITVSKYHTFKYKCKGEKHGKRTNITTETQARINQRIATRRLRALMNANFKDGDLYLTPTFFKELRPKTDKAFKKIIDKFIRSLRREFKKEDKEFKYIYTKEIGSRGAPHLHMLIPECSVALVKKCWEWGRCHLEPLYSDGEYIKLAEYFCKGSVDVEGETEEQETEEGSRAESRRYGKNWYGSRNLIKPVEEKQVITKTETFSTKLKSHNGYCYIKNPEGYYYIDKELTLEGINRFGYGYFTYTLHYCGKEKPAGWTERWTWDVGY